MRTCVPIRSVACAAALYGLLVTGSGAEVVVGPAKLPQQGDARTASFRGQVDAGACRLMNGAVTIRRDGSVSWRADVASVERNDAYCTRLIFIDRHQQRLFQFPFICSPTLSDTFHEWRRDNLAIPEHIFANVRAVVRNDKC
jgi:hypothetical protein